MIGLGTVINATAILFGGIIGIFFRRYIKESMQETLQKTSGVCVVFMGLAGTLTKLLYVNTATGSIETQKVMLMILSLVIGALIGEYIGVEAKFEAFGEWLKRKTGNSGDTQFIHAFVTASLTVCIGAMAIIGAMQDGIYGDYSVLAVKAVLDFVIILIMSSALGKGCLFSAVPVAILQGSITILASFLQPFLTDAALDNLSLIGNVLIFCVSINLVWANTIRVANILPAILFAFLPLE